MQLIRFIFLFPLLVLFLGQLQSQETYDILIRNGRVMDGSGNPWFYADIAIRGDEIVKIGQIGEASAETVIDARGKIVSPGFIDIHSHADGNLGHKSGLRAENPLMRAAHNMVMQGVTTLVVNHDGRSPRSIAAQRKQLEEQGFGPNAAILVGHNTLRFLTLGSDYKRQATPEELEAMKASLRESLEAGAYGLSAGLEYVPGRWSNTEEVIELVRELKPYGGVYIVHERYSGSDPMWYLPSRDGESPGTILDNVREVIRVAEATGVPSCATHIKVKGADFWGVSTAIVNLIDRARSRGVEVWADQYPYNTTGSDGNTMLIPDWALNRERWQPPSLGDNGNDGQEEDSKPNITYAQALEQVWSDPERKKDLIKDIEREIERRGGVENIIVFDFPDSSLIGKSILQISEEKEMSPVEVAVFLQKTGFPDRPGGARLRGFSLSELDIEILAQQPWLITASDAGIGLPGGRPVHARYYGTFPRKIAYYAKERGVLSVEDAIRSMTSLPAQFMGFQDRGLLREGNKADIVIFDLEKLKDKATFFEPHQYPEGIEQVLINGVFMVRNGNLTENLPGRIITNNQSFRKKDVQP